MKIRSKMNKANNQKGFTLVELMVVVVIIGILVAIAVPLYSSVTARADRAAVKANLRTIDGAIMSYQATNDVTAVTVANATTLLQQWPVGPKGTTYTIDASTRAAVASNPGAIAGVAVNDNVEDVD